MLRRTVKSASRTFEVLELFLEHRRPLRLSDIYKALGYPQSSTTNLLKSMVITGYLNYNRHTRAYLPTTRVSALGSWLPGFIHGDNSYRKLVEEIQRRTNETVALATQNDLFIQYVILISPDHEYKMPPPEGAMRLMAKSSSGYALMSGMKDREIDKICRYTNYYQLGGDKPVQFEEVIRDVRWARKIGFAYYNSTLPTPELSSISMRLDEQLHGIPLTIGVGGFANRIAAAKVDIVNTMQSCIAAFKAQKQDEQALMGKGPMDTLPEEDEAEPDPGFES